MVVGYSHVLGAREQALLSRAMTVGVLVLYKDARTVKEIYSGARRMRWPRLIWALEGVIPSCELFGHLRFEQVLLIKSYIATLDR